MILEEKLAQLREEWRATTDKAKRALIERRAKLLKETQKGSEKKDAL